MKVYLFIETEEVRVAKLGEWYTNSRGEVFRVEATVTGGERNVVTRHEIEVPEGAYELDGHFHVLGDCLVSHTAFSFPIYHPKKKVKKWYWVVQGKEPSAGYWNANACPRTEEEIRQAFPDAKWYHRIDETMVEVPE